MRLDPKTLYDIQDPLEAGYYIVDDHESDSIDMALTPCVTFIVSTQGVGAAGTIDAKLQYSDDNSTWTDEPDTTMGNDTAITQLTAAGQALLNVVNPRGGYYRVYMTVGVNPVNAGVISVAGPLRHKAA